MYEIQYFYLSLYNKHKTDFRHNCHPVYELYLINISRLAIISNSNRQEITTVVREQSNTKNWNLLFVSEDYLIILYMKKLGIVFFLTKSTFSHSNLITIHG